MNEHDPVALASGLVDRLSNGPDTAGLSRIEQYGHRHPSNPPWYELWATPDRALQAEYHNGILSVLYVTDHSGETQVHVDKHGRLHLWGDTIPTVRYPDGTLFYFQNGLAHRRHGPSEVHPDGRLRWHRRGALIGLMGADGIPRMPTGDPVKGRVALWAWHKRCPGANG